jgi:hypothetical protein
MPKQRYESLQKMSTKYYAARSISRSLAIARTEKDKLARLRVNNKQTNKQIDLFRPLLASHLLTLSFFVFFLFLSCRLLRSAFLSPSTTIRSSLKSSDMYSSIDRVCERVDRKLKRFKERRVKGLHSGGGLEQDEESAATFFEQQENAIVMGDSEDLEWLITEEDEWAEEEAQATRGGAEDYYPSIEDEEYDYFSELEIGSEPTVTKIKSFDFSKAMTVAEAIFALDCK